MLAARRGEITKRRGNVPGERGNSGFSQPLRGCRFSDTKAIMDFFNKRPRLNSFDQFTRANSHPPRPPRRPSPSPLGPPLSYPAAWPPFALWRLALRDLRGSKNLPLIKRPALPERRLPFSWASATDPAPFFLRQPTYRLCETTPATPIDGKSITFLAEFQWMNLTTNVKNSVPALGNRGQIYKRNGVGLWRDRPLSDLPSKVFFIFVSSYRIIAGLCG